MSCLPILPECVGDGVLVVIVSLLPQDSREALENAVNGRIDSWWQGSVNFVSCFDDMLQRENERAGRDGSVGQIYELAIIARTLGWKQFIIVDALSREQLTGKVRPGRSTDVSVIYMQIENGTKVDWPLHWSKNAKVLAKRMPVDTAVENVRYRLIESCVHSAEVERRLESPQEHYDLGMLLYDPLKPLYDKGVLPSPNMNLGRVESAVDQVLSLDPLLPLEIAMKITDYAHEDVDVDKLTSAPTKFMLNEKRLDVHLLVPMEPGEVDSLEFAYNEKLRASGRDTTCVLYPWISPRPAKRQDIWRLFHRMYENSESHTTFLFAGWPGWQKGVEVGLVQWDYGLPPPTRRVPIERAAEVWYAVHHKGPPYHSGRCRKCDDPSFELMLDPRARFFYDPPPFVSLLKGGIVAPAFFLTRHHTEQEVAGIKGEMYKEGDSDSFEFKDYTFLEWQSDHDGTVENMWHLLWQCRRYREDGSTSAAIFIDQQSASDHKVIVAEVMYNAGSDYSRSPVIDDEYGPYTGMLYGRYPAKEAMIMWCNLDVANMSVEDFFYRGSIQGEDEEYQQYFRPGVIWKNRDEEEDEELI